MPAHSNALVAALFFVAVLVSDALTAIDTMDHADVPASLRGTSLALVSCFAAPLLVRPERGIYGWLQRPIIGTALLAAALAGVHHGGAMTRASDAFYTTLVCLAVTWLFSAGGVDEMTRASSKGDKIDKAVSTSSAMLAASLLLYGSVRIMRAGLSHAGEVRNFRAQSSGLHNASAAIETLGYAYASDTATVAMSFGGAVGIGASIVMVVHVRELAIGTGSVALQLGVAAAFQMLAALATSLTYGDQVDWLPAVFASGACVGPAGGCDAAIASRRFAMVNTQVPGLWLSSLGLFALAYPVDNRFKNRNDAVNYVWDSASSIFGLVVVSGVLLLIYDYSDFSGSGGHTDYVTLIVIFAVYWGVFWDMLIGTLIITAAYAVEEGLLLADYGFETLFSRLSHLSLVVCIGLLALHSLVQGALVFWQPRWLQVGLGMLTVAGMSTAVSLYCASCCMLMSTNGATGLLADVDGGSHFAISFTLQHFVPVLVWAPLYACRCEVQLLSRCQRLAAWLGVVPLVGAIYALALTAMNISPPDTAILEPIAVASCIVGVGVLPWLAASSV
jgi:hypothetical protein